MGILLLIALLAIFVAAQDTSISSAIASSNPAAESNNPGGAGAGDFGGLAPSNITALSTAPETTVSSIATSTPPSATQNSGTGGGAGSGDTGGNAPSGASSLGSSSSHGAS